MIAESKTEEKDINGKGSGESYQPGQLAHFPITTYITFSKRIGV